jgi:pyruvate,water dikinase
LNVEGVDQVLAAVVDCWASFFSRSALSYRQRKGSLEDLRIAVVIQRMVHATKSGILFTADPVHKRLGRMVVEAVRGSGAELTAGRVSPDHYILTRDGIVEDERPANGGVLEQAELALLAELGRRVERRFGVPQDIEWAMDGESIYLLQSRPVTTL